MGVKDIWAKGALAEELDALSLDMAGVSSKIGQSDDTGGTTAIGTVFGKLNRLIGDFAGHISNWTAARAAKIDKIDSTVGAIKSSYSRLQGSSGTVLALIPGIDRNILDISGHGFVDFAMSSFNGVSVIITVDGTSNSLATSQLFSSTDNKTIRIEFAQGLKITLSNSGSSTINNIGYYYYYEF